MNFPFYLSFKELASFLFSTTRKNKQHIKNIQGYANSRKTGSFYNLKIKFQNYLDNIDAIGNNIETCRFFLFRLFILDPVQCSNPLNSSLQREYLTDI